MEHVHITERIAIPLSEIDFSYARSSGPGGQNVNKVETKVVLRFDLAGSESIPPRDRARAMRKLASRLTKAGELLIRCDRFRDRERNRSEAVARFRELLCAAVTPPRRRVPTKPSRAQRERRLSEKKHRGGIKRERGRTDD